MLLLVLCPTFFLMTQAQQASGNSNTNAALNEAQCADLGFAADTLRCADCDKLEKATKNHPAIVAECRSCCISSDGTEDVRYVSGVLKVCN